MDMSKVHLHSIGLVSANKPMSTDMISVILVESRFSNDEEILTNPNSQTVDFKTQGGQESVKVTLDNSVPAKWLKSNSNRVSSPDVRRGDRVKIYRVGDTDEYYWEDMNTENVKRLETVTYAFSADPDNPMKDDRSNAYVIEVSSHQKTLTISTSDANGEKAKFNVQINGGDGILVVEDDKDNNIYLDSVNSDIRMKNSFGTMSRLNKKNIEMFAPDSMFLKVANLINFQCKDFVMSSKTVTMQNNNTTIEADKVLVNAPQTTFTGNVTTRSLSVGGSGMQDSGFAEIRGKVEFYNTVNFRASVTFQDQTVFKALANFQGGTTGDRT